MIWNISRLGSKRVIQGFIGIFTVVFIIAGIGVLGLNKLSKSLKAVYKNSLIPERDLATIIKLQYDNRFHLEELLTGLSANKNGELLNAIAGNNRRLDAILNKHITDDYFMPIGKEHLKEYQRSLKQYRILERKVISLHEVGKTDSSNTVFKLETYVPFSDAIKRLERLEDEELKTGAEEVKTTLELANQVRLLMYIAVFVAILIAVILGTVVGRSIIDR